MALAAQDPATQLSWKWRVVEIISALCLLISKIFLTEESSIGWMFSCGGYALVCTYNYKREYASMAINSAGLTLLGVYGWYKLGYDIEGLQLLDYGIILASLFCVSAAWVKRDKDKAGSLQFWIPLFTFSAFLALGMDFTLYAWMLFLISHCLIGIFYIDKKSWFYVGLQVISFGIAAYQVWNLS